MRFWWVNQNQTHRQEIAGGYLWSPKRRADGVRHHYYETMREVAPDDVVFSFFNQSIGAIGVARSYCYESPKPPEFGTAGPHWDRIGWRVDAAFTTPPRTVRPRDHIANLRALLPKQYSPLREDGAGIQTVYLTEIGRPMAAFLADLIGGEVRELVAAQPGTFREKLPTAPAPGLDDWEDHIQQEIRRNRSIPETQRTALIRARRGQGLFKQRVMEIERFCRITRVENPAHLIGGHIKPWRDSDNEERLDGENGLLLTPTIDHLFDRGFISFKNSGDLLVSPRADELSLRRMGIRTDQPVNVGGFSSRQERFLDYHRDCVFLRAAR